MDHDLSVLSPIPPQSIGGTVFFSRKPTRLTEPEESLQGRPERPFEVGRLHAVLGTPLEPPFPADTEVAYVALGCFWGAERIFWQTPGVVSTAVGYQGGHTPNPTYDEVCSGRTAHTEVVKVVFDPKQVSYADLMRAFWEGHDPTQGFRQGNDVGTQYRSAIYWTTDEQREVAEATKKVYDEKLRAAGYGGITTEVLPADGRRFYYAEDYHQQYLFKNPNGYCGIGGTGVSCPVGVAGA
jgi:peptide-methionine (S)-S-oxide reductase